MKSRFEYPGGIVLIVVVYIVSALSVLLFAMTFRSRLAIKEAALLIEGVQRDQVARAACAQARSTLLEDDASVDYLDEACFGLHRLEPSEMTDEFTEAAESDWEIYWRLVDESSKINVNLSYSDLLTGLECLDEAAAASILDWVDEDDVAGPDGAENDYYANLEPAYNCKNGPIENIEELLLIKGISGQIYYGWNPGERENLLNETDISSAEFTDENLQDGSVGLNDLLTIYGDGRININTVSKQVLDAIPLLSDGAVSDIISRQTSSDGKFGSMNDIENSDDFTAADKLSLMQIAKFNSNHFRVEIMVRKKEHRFWNEYAAVIERSGTNTHLLSWQHKFRNVLKDEAIFAANDDEIVYSEGLE